MKKKRLLIVTDGKGWFVRRVSMTCKDNVRGEMIYHCDKPIGKRFARIGDAVRAAKTALSSPKARVWR